MIIKDKEIKQQMQYLYHLVLALARLHGVKADTLWDESRNVKENILYMVAMFDKTLQVTQKQHESKNNV